MELVLTAVLGFLAVLGIGVMAFYVYCLIRAIEEHHHDD